MERLESEFSSALFEIGRMTYVWTNTESLLVHLISALLDCDKDRALLVYLTLNTTRARIDLVERLAKSGFTSKERSEKVLDCTRRLAKFSGARNLYNHAIYSVNSEDGGISTIQMRISETKQGLKIGRRKRLDRAAIEDIQQVIRDLTELNQEMWQIVHSFGRA